MFSGATHISLPGPWSGLGSLGGSEVPAVVGSDGEALKTRSGDYVPVFVRNASDLPRGSSPRDFYRPLYSDSGAFLDPTFLGSRDTFRGLDRTVEQSYDLVYRGRDWSVYVESIRRNHARIQNGTGLYKGGPSSRDFSGVRDSVRSLLSRKIVLRLNSYAKGVGAPEWNVGVPGVPAWQAHFDATGSGERLARWTAAKRDMWNEIVSTVERYGGLNALLSDNSPVGTQYRELYHSATRSGRSTQALTALEEYAAKTGNGRLGAAVGGAMDALSATKTRAAFSAAGEALTAQPGFSGGAFWDSLGTVWECPVGAEFPDNFKCAKPWVVGGVALVGLALFGSILGKIA